MRRIIYSQKGGQKDILYSWCLFIAVSFRCIKNPQSGYGRHVWLRILRFGILAEPQSVVRTYTLFFMTACRLLPVKFPICETCLTY